MLLGMFVTTASAYDIEVPNADGVMIYYVWQNDGTELAVSYGGKNVIMGKNNYAAHCVKGAEEAARYTMDGRHLSKPQPGVNIVRMTDGTTKKVIVKK